MVVIVPGVVTNLNDTVTGTATTQFPIHGGRNNALNSSAILTYSNTFVRGGIWLQPQSVLTGRPARISAEFSF